MAYFKIFDEYSQYEEYINKKSTQLPNVSVCLDTNKVYYTPKPEDKIIAKCLVEPITEITLWFDDFPEEIADDEYNGDMDAFKQNAIDNIDDNINEYVYTGETLNYDGTDYYLWENVNIDQGESVLPYILTNTLDFTGLSLEENINSDYCPFVYILNSDKTVEYDNEQHSDYWLVAVRGGGSSSSIKLLNNTSAFSKVEIDDIMQPSVTQNYELSTGVEHTIKYTLADSTTLPSQSFKDCDKLTEITIPQNIASIGDYSLNGCGNLTKITVEGKTPPTLMGNNTFTNTNDCPICVPSDSVNRYKSAARWNDFANRIQSKNN